jgi:Kef-type K+ transport system membrane component KefB
MEIVQEFGLFTGIFAAAYVIAAVMRRIKIPRVVGFILLGLGLNALGLSDVLLHSFPSLPLLSKIAVTFILGLTGFEVNYAEFRKTTRAATVFAVSTVVVCTIVGMGVMLLYGYGLLTAFTIGLCISITGEAVVTMAMRDLKMIDTPICSTILVGGIVDNIFEIFLLVVITTLANADAETDLPIAIGGLVVLGLMVVIIPLVMKHVFTRTAPDRYKYVVILSFFSCALVSALFQLDFVLGAFVGGVVARRGLDLKYSNLPQGLGGDEDPASLLSQSLEPFIDVFAPFLFMVIALYFSFPAFFAHFWLMLAMLVAAYVGKVGGALLGKPLTDFSWRESLVVGIGMNARAIFALVVATIGFEGGLFGVEVFSTIIIMALMTCLITPLALKYTVQRFRGRPDFTKGTSMRDACVDRGSS